MPCHEPCAFQVQARFHLERAPSILQFSYGIFLGKPGEASIPAIVLLSRVPPAHRCAHRLANYLLISQSARIL